MKTTTMDAYSVLGVPPTASQEELEAAYKSRLALLHPDRMAGRSQREQEVAAAMLAELQDAWALVGDQRVRSRYDSERQQAQDAQEHTGNGAWGPAPPADGARSAWEREQADLERQQAVLQESLHELYGAPLGFWARHRISSGKGGGHAPLLTALALALCTLAARGAYNGHVATAVAIVLALVVGSARGRRVA